jgi:hypothetical protein
MAARTDSDRVRAEVHHTPRIRHGEIARVVRQSIAAIAAHHRRVTAEEIFDACEQVLAEQPINAPRQLARPLSALASHTAIGVRLLPPLSWTLTALSGAERQVLVFTSDELAVIGDDDIGDIVAVQLFQAAATDTATLPNTLTQVDRHLDALADRYGERALGVATFTLGHAHQSTLTLASSRRVVPYTDTALSEYPHGRLT